MKHIMGIIDTTKTWCGEPVTISFGENPFKTVEHAAMNGFFPSDPPKSVCRNCIMRVLDALLLNNPEVHNDESN